ncbi:hypothetical protein C0J52_01021 [Blattella germanica]|nr:hypothetical protein C0J52_01021 [Blattella germanica]
MSRTEKMDFPDPDEEFELMHAEEMEMLKELEESQSVPEEGNCRKSRRSLDFTSPIQNGGSSNLSQQSVAPLPQSQSSQSSSAGWAQPSQSSQLHPVNQQTEKKRKVQELFGDITDIDFEERTF